ncbi:Uncharacterized conserved protein [Loktanella atrilutea]|uniref:Uncharacterized conserved protein n=1 Tax=Loktanella atrilutea TaxID=366533 RepID=A0A1M4WYG4_LOKAT|nr:extensin family protein [Loktanella atrilutea]SHE86331.1 Uncharacterized conserved protein [Loktanella atrilutea]
MTRVWPAAVLVLLATSALAQGPGATLRPALRPDSVVTIEEEGAAPPEEIVTIRPVLRPGGSIAVAEPPDDRDVTAGPASPLAPQLTDRPALRPAAITQRAVRQQQELARGQICGDPAIQGEEIADIAGPGGCGVIGAVRVKSVAGIRLTEQPTIDCNTAKALRRWVTDGIVPAVGDTGGGVAALRVVGHYTCRNRVGGSATNNKLSEHGRGRAVDIGGIQLKNGRELTVATDWNRGAAGRQLKAMWSAACGPFGTVLGPGANAAHHDHFHVDTARYRSGSYCR